MSNFDASTPQLEVAKNLLDAVTSFDLGKLTTTISENYQYEAFNGVADQAKLDKEGYAKLAQGLFAGLTKFDVSIQQRRTTLSQADPIQSLVHLP